MGKKWKNYHDEAEVTEELDIFEAGADNEPEEVVDEVSEPEVKHGKVVGCSILAVRFEPSTESVVVNRIEKGDTVEVYLEQSTKDFYRVCTAAGVRGYCMKKYIEVG